MRRAVLFSAIGLIMVALSACMSAQNNTTGSTGMETPEDAGGGGY